MLHWALPPKAFAEYERFENWLKENGRLDQYGRFIRGGHWRGFLAKYPEANLMHKKMLAVSKKIQNARADKLCEKNDNDRLRSAQKFLYAAQCNCPYWHGVFGGLYLPHLRAAIYENLIRAENVLDKRNPDEIEINEADYDSDGRIEIIVRTNKFISVIRPGTGGALIELDCRPSNFNPLDTLNRRREGYHWKLNQAQINDTPGGNSTASIHDLVVTKEEGLDRLLADDWYLRRGFIDHFLSPDTDIHNFLSGHFRDLGDFVLEPYEAAVNSSKKEIDMSRTGTLTLSEGPGKLRIEKRYSFEPKSDVIAVSYSLLATEKDVSSAFLAIENNFNFQAGHAADRYLLFEGEKVGDGYLDAVVEKRDCRQLTLHDEWRDFVIGIITDSSARIWQIPIFTVSLSEAGFEKVYQGTSLVHLFNLDLKKDRPFKIGFQLFAGKPADMPDKFRAGIIKTGGA
jgi:alpha-amylase